MLATMPHSFPENPPELEKAAGESPAAERGYAEEQAGFHTSLSSRQMQMIAIGGAIGTGLFMATGGRLHDAGPSVALIFLVCGFFAFLILRALGELVLHRPSSGSFVSYAREFLGEKAAFVAGWMYFLNWAMTGIVDATAAAIYVQYWSAFTTVPQWILALIALAVVVSVNLLSVKVFGELEFWFALVKVTALVAFLVIGIVFLAAGGPPARARPASDAPEQWRILPDRRAPAVIMTQGVIFAYAGIELVGTAAGETAEPAKVMPKAINSVIVRVAVFYVGSVLILSLLLPYTVYSGRESPFVTFFSSIGSPALGDIAGSVMNLVVLTAALSSLNAGLYSTGRILHSMSSNGAAPRFTGRMNKQAFRTAAFSSRPLSRSSASASTRSCRTRRSRSFSTSPLLESSPAGPRSCCVRSSCSGGRSVAGSRVLPSACSGRPIRRTRRSAFSCSSSCSWRWTTPSAPSRWVRS